MRLAVPIDSKLKSVPCPHFGGANSHLCDYHQGVNDGMHEYTHIHTLSISDLFLATWASQLSVAWS